MKTQLMCWFFWFAMALTWVVSGYFIAYQQVQVYDLMSQNHMLVEKVRSLDERVRGMEIVRDSLSAFMVKSRSDQDEVRQVTDALKKEIDLVTRNIDEAAQAANKVKGL